MLRKIHCKWFYSNCENIKISDHSKPVKNFHVRDIEKFVRTDNVKEFPRNCSS